MSRRSLHRDCSTIVSPWLHRNNAANASVVPLPFRFVMLSVARFTLVVRRRLTFVVTTVAPLQALEQQSTVAAFRNKIELPVDVVVVVVVLLLPHRTSTMIDLSTMQRRSPFTMTGLHQLFMDGIS